MAIIAKQGSFHLICLQKQKIEFQWTLSIGQQINIVRDPKSDAFETAFSLTTLYTPQNGNSHRNPVATAKSVVSRTSLYF